MRSTYKHTYTYTHTCVLIPGFVVAGLVLHGTVGLIGRSVVLRGGNVGFRSVGHVVVWCTKT